MEATETATTIVATDAGTTMDVVTVTRAIATMIVAATAAAAAVPAATEEATTVLRVDHPAMLLLADTEALATLHHLATTMSARAGPTIRKEVKVGSLD